MMCDCLHQADLNSDASLSSSIWISLIILADWIWQFPSEFEASSHQDVCCIKCQSDYELEGDASIDGLFDCPMYICVLSSQLHVRIFPYLGFANILNQQFRNYSSLTNPFRSENGSVTCTNLERFVLVAPICYFLYIC